MRVKLLLLVDHTCERLMRHPATYRLRKRHYSFPRSPRVHVIALITEITTTWNGYAPRLWTHRAWAHLHEPASFRGVLEC